MAKWAIWVSLVFMRAHADDSSWIPAQLWRSHDAAGRIWGWLSSAGTTGDVCPDDDDASKHGANERDGSANGTGWSSCFASLTSRKRSRLRMPRLPNPSRLKFRMEQNSASIQCLSSHLSDPLPQDLSRKSLRQSRYVATRSGAPTRDVLIPTPVLSRMKRRAWYCQMKRVRKERRARMRSASRVMSARLPSMVSLVAQFR